MSREVFMRGLFSGIFSLIFVWIVFSRYAEETESEKAAGKRQKYLPYLSGGVLPTVLFTLFILDTVYYDINHAARETLAACFGVFLHISARACAMLWMIPNYLYITLQSFMELPSPRLVITAPGSWMRILFTVWGAGFIIVLFWKIAEHLIFRHRILKDAAPVTDPTILTVWQRIVEDARMQKFHCKLVTSPNVKTPLSIGLFRLSTRVILPRHSYSPEELNLILRHEIIHIGREDAWSKFFLMFCTAICWFNPLMWMAMRRSAEDLELSCDETVLADANENTRKKYASLLLDTAGDEHGFTTCLSASAKAMRHRLKNIIHPTKRRSGALIVGFVFFILCMTSGYVALAYDGTSAAELIFTSGDVSQYTLKNVNKGEDAFGTVFEITDPNAFTNYLADLTLYQLTGNYTFSEGERFTCVMETPQGPLGIELFDHAIKLISLYGKSPKTACYYISEGIDWDYLNTITYPLPESGNDRFIPHLLSFFNLN